MSGVSATLLHRVLIFLYLYRLLSGYSISTRIWQGLCFSEETDEVIHLQTMVLVSRHGRPNATSSWLERARGTL